MKTRCCRTLCVLLLVVTGWAARGVEVDLAASRIVWPVKASAPVRRAADELAHHLRLIAGRTQNGAGVEFRFARPTGEKRPARDTAHAAFRDGVFYFWGDDAEKPVRQPANGSLFAVYGFLEELLGVRWVAPGEDGIVFRATNRLDVAANWRYTFRPPLELTLVRDYGEGRLLAGNPYVPPALRLTEEEAHVIADDRRLWQLRLRHQTRTRFKYGHAFRDWQSKYLATNPEYFGLSPYGTRGLPGKKGGEFVKLCLSNEAAVDRILTNWVARGAAQFLNVCPNDGTPGYCFCANCRALDADRPGERFHAHKTDRYVNFWNRVVGKARQIRPDVRVVTYIYSYYRFPPRREKIAWPENMYFGFVPSMTDDIADAFAGWKAAGMRHFFLRPNFLCYRGQVPRGLERWLYENFHEARRYGATGVDYDGRIGRWTQALEYYVVGRMVARPDLAFETICDEFYLQYGAAAPVARQYFECVRLRGEASLEKLCAAAQADRVHTLDDGELSSFSVNGHTAAALASDVALLKTADLAALSPVERRRFTALVRRAEVAELVVTFLAATEDEARESAARALRDYRVRHRADLPEEYGNIVRDTELAQWKKTRLYAAEVMAGASNPIDPAAGWRASFDAPGLGDWLARDLFVDVTDRTASFDKFSVRCRATATGGLGVWRHNAPVTPCAAYHLAGDVKLDEGVSTAVLRVVAEDGEKGRVTLAKIPFARRDDWWQSGETTFTVPSGCTKASIYFALGPAAHAGAFVYLDNVTLTREKTLTP